MSPAVELRITTLPDFPHVAAGDDLAAMTADASGVADAGLAGGAAPEPA